MLRNRGEEERRTRKTGEQLRGREGGSVKEEGIPFGQNGGTVRRKKLKGKLEERNEQESLRVLGCRE